MSIQLASALVVAALVAFGLAPLAAPAQQYPGEPTKARVWIENRSSEEAIPVSVREVDVASPIGVELVSPARVVLEPGSQIATQIERQAWEYRTVTPAADQDLASVLTELGKDGWEATAVLPAGSGSSVLMKRPL